MPAHTAPVSRRPGGTPLHDGQTLVTDGLSLCVRLSARRKRLGLTVERDGTLTLSAPLECDTRRAEDFVRGSRHWIDSKVRLSERRRQLHPVRSLHDGEIHRYLGRDYRLLLVDGAERKDTGSQERGCDDPAVSALPVRLMAGRLRLDRSLADEPRLARKAIAAWYTTAGQRWIRGRLQPWAARLDVCEPTVEVRDVGRRWGTFRNRADGTGRMSLHWAVFQLPAPLVDYVIAHELAHIRVAGHGADYWRLLERALPECRRLKAELDELGRRVWMGDLAGRG
jgi:predicted metal-dependent hydrolase